MPRLLTDKLLKSEIDALTEELEVLGERVDEMATQYDKELAGYQSEVQKAAEKRRGSGRAAPEGKS